MKKTYMRTEPGENSMGAPVVVCAISSEEATVSTSMDIESARALARHLDRLCDEAEPKLRSMNPEILRQFSSPTRAEGLRDEELQAKRDAYAGKR